MHKWVKMGKIGKPHGLEGWLSVYTDADMERYSPWFIEINKDWQPLPLTEIRHLNQKTIIHLQDINTPEAAQSYSGKIIAIPRNQLPALPPHQYYWTDLENLNVINLQQQALGKIDYLFQTGAQSIMVVKDKHRRRLIPFQRPQIVKAVDLDKGQIIIDWDTEF